MSINEYMPREHEEFHRALNKLEDTISRLRTLNGRNEVTYSYENNCGVLVATRTLPLTTCVNGGSWRVCLFFSPDEHKSFVGLDGVEAERMCVQHASLLS